MILYYILYLFKYYIDIIMLIYFILFYLQIKIKYSLHIPKKQNNFKLLQLVIWLDNNFK